MTAPAPSPAEQAVIDRFGIFEPEERVAEEVARAIDEARDAHGTFYFPCKCGWEAGFGAGWEDRGDRHRLLSIATAAVAAVRAAPDSGAEQAVRRVEALAEQLDSEAETAEQVAFSTVSANRRAAARRIRAALAPQAQQ